MRKIYLIFSLLFLLGLGTYSQSVEKIKLSPLYFWGEGTGTTLNKADQEALGMLISQISTQVESSFTLLKEDISRNGGGEDIFSETFHSVINTYSNATLKNTDRIVLGNEPEARVFRYIKREEVAKVFEERENKIEDFVRNADKCVLRGQIADGLRYYYWALTLLKSHPSGNEIEYKVEDGSSQLLATWLPMQINNLFTAIDIGIRQKEAEDDYLLVTLAIDYKSNPVVNFDYSYWDGSDWSNLISARDGIGLVELYGLATATKDLRIKAEYIFEGEASVDGEVEDVLKKIDPVPFRASYYNVPLKSKKNVPDKKAVVSDIADAPLTEISDAFTYKKSISNILNGIRTKDYDNLKDEFTAQGYLIFDKLIKYGNAKVAGEPELRFIKFDDTVICRSVPLSFNFKNNDREFIENVVFYFNSEGQVDNLTFGLSQIALDSIIQREIWKERDRIILVNFLENYKTAYALKRIEYIEQIFADDALIITGSIVKVKPDDENRYKDNRIIKYNRQSKQEYMKNLRYSFGSKEYINIEFEDSDIRKAGKGGDIYGVQIKQNYFSSNYGDTGYLFLMVDLNSPDEPVIHVRTWQPEVGANDSVYSLSDFN